MTPEQMIGLYFDLARINAGVSQNPISIRELDATEMVQMLWPFVTEAAGRAKAQGDLWHDDAVDEVDSVFYEMAESGKSTIEVVMSPQALTEFSRRCNYGLMAMMMEEKQKTGYTVAVPADVPEGNIKIGLLIYVGSGIGRDYPKASYGRTD